MVISLLSSAIEYSFHIFIVMWIEQQAQQLKTLKDHLDEEITFHQQRVKEHQDAIATHQQRIDELEKKKSS